MAEESSSGGVSEMTEQKAPARGRFAPFKAPLVEVGNFWARLYGKLSALLPPYS